MLAVFGSSVILAAAIVYLIWTYPTHARECGIASWYAYTGHRTASGEPYTGSSMTAAHKRLPFGTRVRVTVASTGSHVDVKINDRGPYVRGRIIDLSSAARRALGMGGTAAVCLDILR